MKSANLVSVKTDIEADYSQLKSRGVGNTELTREIYLKTETRISDVKLRLSSNQAAVERLDSILLSGTIIVIAPSLLR